MRDWLIILCIVLFCFFTGMGLAPNAKANEQPKLLVYQYSFEVRIVLSDKPCPNNQGWQAAAQRIDRLVMPACWVQDPYNELNVKITWPDGDFSVFELEKFKPFTE